MLQRRGYPVVDADKLSRDVLMPGEPALAALIERFGYAIVDEHGRLKRRELGKTVFGDDKARHDLNAIVHPAVARRSAEVFASWISSGEALGFYDAALLFEAGSYRQFPLVLVVAAPVDLQMARIASRDVDLSEEDARARIAAQMPLEDKVQRADVVIYNDGDLSTLERRVDQALARIHALLGLHYTGASHG